MRRSITIAGMLFVLVLAGALPAFALDRDLLGSGAVAPAGGGEAAAPVEVVVAPRMVTAGEDILVSTGLDAAAALLLGAGLTAAGGAAIFASRKRARS